MPKRAAEDGADASTKKAKKAPKNVGDDIIKLESDSEGDGIPVPVAKNAARKEAAKLRKKIAGAFGREKDDRPKVLYIGHVPHGFYEEQMRGYFSQFGEVSRLRLSRNKKTGKSKHYAFVEFKHPEVAEIVAESMNNYLLFESVLKVRLMTEEECHPEIWKGANRKFKQVPWQKKAADVHDRERTTEEQKKRTTALKSKERQRRKKIAASGIEYDFPGYAGGDAGVDDAQETKKPAVKKTPAKRAAAAAKEKATPAKKKAKTPLKKAEKEPARSTRSTRSKA